MLKFISQFIYDQKPLSKATLTMLLLCIATLNKSFGAAPTVLPAFFTPSTSITVTFEVQLLLPLRMYMLGYGFLAKISIANTISTLQAATHSLAMPNSQNRLPMAKHCLALHLHLLLFSMAI
jgi:hypothetical protein